MIVETNSAEETFLLGKKMGEEAHPGEVYTLIGDLGVGKTVFTQGVASGLGILEPISSPTFTILQIYETGRMPFYHFDVYRIGDSSEMEEIGYEDCIFGTGLCLIEWADRIEEILPEQYTKVVIEKELGRGFDYRRINIKLITDGNQVELCSNVKLCSNVELCSTYDLSACPKHADGYKHENSST